MTMEIQVLAWPWGWGWKGRVMVFNATFNNISVILWRSVREEQKCGGVS